VFYACLTMTMKRQPWTLEEWKAFAARCRTTRRRLGAAASHVSNIPQTTVRASGALIDAKQRVDYALLALETPLVRAHWIPPIRLLRLLHGDEAYDPEPGEERHLPEIGRAQRRSGILPKWVWRLEARRLGTLALALVRLQADLGEGLTEVESRRAMSRLKRAQGGVALARALLESVYAKHYPNANDVHRVFLGNGSKHFRPVSFNEDGTIDFTATEFNQAEL
jgi:hypothetical protein